MHSKNVGMHVSNTAQTDMNQGQATYAAPHMLDCGNRLAACGMHACSHKLQLVTNTASYGHEACLSNSCLGAMPRNCALRVFHTAQIQLERISYSPNTTALSAGALKQT